MKILNPLFLEALLEYVEKLKASEEDFFTIESDDLGTKWFGKCWIFHFHQKREFAFEIEIPVMRFIVPSNPSILY